MSWLFHCFPVKLLLSSIWNYSLPAVSNLSPKKITKKKNIRKQTQYGAGQGSACTLKRSNDNGRGKQQPASPLGSPLILHHCRFFPTQSLYFCMFTSVKCGGESASPEDRTTTGDAGRPVSLESSTTRAFQKLVNNSHQLLPGP